MAFRDDWLREHDRLRRRVNPAKLDERMRHEYDVFESVAKNLERATVVRLRGDQGQIFLDAPAVEGQDYVQWLRLPYPSMYIALDAPIRFESYMKEFTEDERAALMQQQRELEAQAHAVLDRIYTDIADEASKATVRRLRAVLADVSRGRRAISADERREIDALFKEYRDEIEPRIAEGNELLDAARAIRDLMLKNVKSVTRDGESASLIATPLVRGVLIAQSDEPFGRVRIGPKRLVVNVEPDAVDDETGRVVDAVRLFTIVFFMPTHDDISNMHTASMAVGVDNALHTSLSGFVTTRQTMINWAVHVINFLSSPSVKLVRNEHDVALQKARQRREQEPLPGWYEITYRKHIQDYTKEKISPTAKRWEHSYRYDVRGHFMRFTRGRLSGRVIWCPPHQRGLKHELYRPKGYVTEPAR